MSNSHFVNSSSSARPAADGPAGPEPLLHQPDGPPPDITLFLSYLPRTAGCRLIDQCPDFLPQTCVMCDTQTDTNTNCLNVNNELISVLILHQPKIQINLTMVPSHVCWYRGEVGQGYHLTRLHIVFLLTINVAARQRQEGNIIKMRSFEPFQPCYHHIHYLGVEDQWKLSRKMIKLCTPRTCDFVQDTQQKMILKDITENFPPYWIIKRQQYCMWCLSRNKKGLK